MIEIPLIDELREIRRRLAEEQGCDPARYASMLREISRDLPGKYVDRPLLPEGTEMPQPSSSRD